MTLVSACAEIGDITSFPQCEVVTGGLGVVIEAVAKGD